MTNEATPKRGRPKAKPDPVDLGEMELVATRRETEDSINESIPKVSVRRMYTGIQMPKFNSDESPCIYLKAHLGNAVETLKAFSPANQTFDVPVAEANGERYVTIPPRCRVAVPTGLSFNVPPGYKMVAFPVDDQSVNNGLGLANSVSIIGKSLSGEVYIVLKNNADIRVELQNDAAIAQVAFERIHQLEIVEEK